MKHIKALSKMDPKAAFSLSGKDGKTACDTILKSPEEKEEKKGSNNES